MAEAGRLTATAGAARRGFLRPVTALRIGIIVAVLAIWELVAGLGPALSRRGALARSRSRVALYVTLSDPTFYFHLATTGYEIGIALVIGGLSGLAVGIALGGQQAAWRGPTRPISTISAPPRRSSSSRS